MQTTIYYVLRSRKDGQYVSADPRRRSPTSQDAASQRPTAPDDADTQSNPASQAASGFLIVFQEHADGLTYLNTHAPELAGEFAVESLTQSQLMQLMQRWQFSGLGLVSDPLLPRVQFMQRQ